ncbi:MAG: amidohydrolase [Bacteroidota bacterium]
MSKLFYRLFAIALFTFTLFSCGSDDSEKGDLIIYGGSIYTVTDSEKTEAVVSKDGKIIFVGSKADALEFKGDSTQIFDLQGKTMTPGLIESHAHIMGIGYNRLNIDLMKVNSYEELIQKVEEVAAKTPKGEWILGRGWHQDKWQEKTETRFKGFPTHDELSARVPDHPVWLKHASGHMGLANAAAMEKAGINRDSPQPHGGEIFMGLGGNPTGIFNETAQSEIIDSIPESTPEREAKALELAVQELLENGITSMHNAGAVRKEIDLFKQFAENDQLKVRVYTMLNGRDSLLLDDYFKSGPEIGLYDDHLTVRSIKLYADGALGSRGAWLLKEYTDAKGKFGHNVMPMAAIQKVSSEGYKNGFQLCVHAIGDRANREVLDIFENTISEGDKNHRFRVEHAQHIALDDIPRFAELDVIASVQAIHMSSDRPWAIYRLGLQRILAGAYVWQKLLQSGAKVINGTDAPVEPVSAIASFYSSVSRKTLKGTPAGGYEPEQKMTRPQALQAYTLDGAYGAFEEGIKGSIEVGKLADFTVFSQDLMTVPEEEILDTQVDYTIVGGKIVYKR